MPSEISRHMERLAPEHVLAKGALEEKVSCLRKGFMWNVSRVGLYFCPELRLFTLKHENSEVERWRRNYNWSVGVARWVR
jgi:hypothetical protein